MGLSAGSFLNVCIYRIPLGESVVLPHSRCPSCGTRLKAMDLLPVLSYFLLKKRCRYCRQAISPRYALVEGLTAITFASVLLRFGPEPVILKYFFLCAVLIVVSFTDLDHMIIPNRVILCGLIAGAAFVPLTGQSLLSTLYGMISAAGLLLVLWLASRGGMGLGDIKLALVIGIFLGWPLSLLAVLTACCLAGLTGIILLALRRKKRKDPIPFGPFLALGAYIGFMWGRGILDWYLVHVLGL